MTYQTRAVRQFSVAAQSSLESFGMDRFSALGDQASVFRASFDNLAGTGRALFNNLSSDPSVLGDSPDGSTITLAAPTVTTTTAGTVLAAGFTDFDFGDGQFAGRAVNPLQANISGDAIVARGEAAFISYETDTSVPASPDALRFVLLTDIAAGTTIYITDRAWTGAAFTNAAGEGTFTYVAGAAQTAGTIITLTVGQLTAAGITLSNGGETVYMYQGAIDAPTRFVFAMDIADGNNAFGGNLTNTGLVSGTSAVAVQFDNAVYAGTPTRIAAAQFLDIATASRWHGTDQDDIGGTTGYTEVHDTTNTNAFNTPDMVMITGMAGGGQSDAILRIGNDANDNGGNNVGTGLTRLFQDNVAFNHITDVTFDIENGFFFFVDSDGNSINRIMRGNIADIVNSNSSPVFTQIFATDGQNNGAGPVMLGELITGIEIDKTGNQVYWWDGSLTGDFEGGWQLYRANYDGTGLTLITTLDTENPDPGTPFGSSGGMGDWALDLSRGFAYAVNSTGSIDGFGNTAIGNNHIIRISLSTGVITVLALGAADGRSNTGPGGVYHDGRLNSNEGQIIALDVDQNTGIVYFITQPESPSASGGIFSYNPVTDDLVELWNQPSNNAHSTLQTFPTNPMTHIEVDEIGGRIYVSDISDSDTDVDGTPATNEDDTSIFSLAIGAPPIVTDPTLFQRVYEPTANGSPLGMEIDYAPVTAVTAANTTYTESNSAPASPAGPPIVVITGSTVTDPDNTVIQGATVAITTGFSPGDTLSFTNSGGITGSYNAANGVVTFTGLATLAQYQTVLNSIRFTNAGDNPTDYGLSPSRTISFTTFDGLANSDPATASITVVGINDAPVNTVPGAQAATEDTGKVITGISVADPDADPANQDIQVTLSVLHGTITLLTNVAGGITGADVTNNGTATVTILATQNQINATIAASGLTYLNIADYNGADTLTVTTNDLGLNGNDPGLTGNGTSEQDQDTVAITVAAVVDIANDSVTFAEDSGVQNLNLLANDTFENAGRSITSVTQGLHGTVTINDNGTAGNTTDDFVVYTQVADYNGTDSFTYTVTSGGVTETATVNVTITAVVDIANDVLNFSEDAGAQTLNVLANDSFENAARFISSVTQGAHGTVTINNNGTAGDLTDDFLVYTQVADYNGTDSFTYTVTSPTGVTETATVNVTISAVVDIANDNVTVNEDSGANALNGVGNPVSLIANDSFENATRFISGVTQGAHGSVAINNNGTAGDATDDYVVYTVTDPNYNGPDTFTYTVTSPAGISETATVNVTIAAVNDAPVNTVPGTQTFNEDTSRTFSTGNGNAISVADVDATSLTVTLTVTNGTLTLSGTAGLSFGAGDGTADATMTFSGTAAAINTALNGMVYAPTPNYNGPDAIQISTTDNGQTGSGGTLIDNDSVTLNITSVNDAPSGANNAVLINEDVTYTFATADFGFTDPLDNNALLAVKITTLATDGKLFYDSDGPGGAAPVLVTVGQTISAVDIAAGKLTFVPDLNENNTPYATFTFQVQDNGGVLNGGVDLDPTPNTFTFNVAAVNDAPVNTVPGTQTINEDATRVFSTGNGNLISVADVDVGAGNLTVTLTVTHGVLTLSGIAGLSFGAGDGTGDSTMTFSGTAAAINTALNGLLYTADANYNGSDTLTVTTNDNGNTGAPGALQDSDPITINITAVNDTPVVSLVPSVASIEQVAGTIDGGATITDVELGALNNYAGSALTVGRNGGPGAQDLLTFGASGAFTVNGANLEAGGLVFATFTGGNGSNLVITFTSSGTPATQALVNAVVQSLQYTYTGDTPPASILMNYSFNDGAPANAGQGGGGSPTGTDAITINISDTPEDAPPVIDLNGGAAGVDNAAAYTEQAAPTVLAAGVTVTDADDTNIESAVVQVGTGFIANLDILTVNGATSGNIGAISFNYVAATGTLTLTGSDTLAAYQAVLAQFGFESTSNDPGATRAITWKVNDGTVDSATATTTITVTQVNDEPTLVATGATPTLTENGAAVDLFSAVTASTIEAGQTFTSLTLTVTNVTDGAAESLTFDGSNVALTNGNAVTTATNGLNVTVTVAAGTATVTFSGAALNAAQLQTLVDNLAYGNNSENPTDANRVITITQLVDSGSNVPSNDNIATLSIAATVDVNPVNDAPVNSVPGTQTFNEDSSRTFSTGNGNAISVADLDVGAGNLTVTLTVTNGTLTLSGTAGLSFGAGDGTGDATMTFSGTAAAINAALNGLVYQPNANYNGADSLQIVTNDNGNSGGAAQSDTDSVTLSITSVNDAPAGTDNAITINEDSTYVFASADFGFSDPADSNAFLAVKFTTLPVSGTLFYDADGPGGAAPVAVVAGQSILNSEIALGKVTFVPNSNANGTPLSTFTFQVQDNGGVLNGGVDLDQSPNTFTVNVTALNDAPVNTVPGTQTFNEDTSRTFSTGNGNAISVADVDASTLTVTLTVTHGTLTLSGTAGLSFGAGDGTADATMTFSGTAAAINTALNGLVYAPTANYNGPDAIQITTSDNGQTGTGGTLTDGDSVSLTINSVNDAPSGADKTVTGSEDDPYVFTAADFGFSDPADSNAFAAISVITFPSPSSGKLFLDFDGPGGAAPVDLATVGSGVFVSIADINAGHLYFQPDPDEFGSPYASFTFKVQDNGGIANGGVDLDPTANTVTINVTPDDLPPVVDLNGAAAGIDYATSFTEDGAAVAIGSGIVASDPDEIPLNDRIETATITLTDKVAGDSLILTAPLPGGFTAVTTTLAGSITIVITGSGTGAQYSALLDSIRYSTTNQDPTFGGTDLTRIVTVVLNDGDLNSATATATITINPVDDAPVAQPDAITTDEGTPVSGSLFADNGSGADSDVDGPALAISAVNGSGANVGVQITLASGALLTVNANGTYAYDPNGAFDPTPTPGSGATNQPDHDSFTYTLAGGNTVTVSLTINGLDTDDLLIGSLGQDVLIAGNGNDTIFALADNDSIDGGAGIDTANLGTSLVLTSTAIGWAIANSEGNDFLSNVEIVIDSGGQRNLLVGSTGFVSIQAALNQAVDDDYIRVANGTWSGTVNYFDDDLFVLAQSGAVLNTTFSTATSFGISVFGGAGSDHITTGANSDSLVGGAGADVLAGDGGSDFYVVDQAGDQVIEGAGGGYDIVFTTSSFTLTAGQEIELLGALFESGTAAIDLGGNAFDNRLVGNDGSNGFYGGGGVDVFYGNGGNDYYVVDSSDDVVIEEVGDGIDIVFTTGASYTLAAGSEVEGLGAYNQSGTVAMDLTGNAFNNFIVGNEGVNTINGGAGADILYGNGGADTFAFTTALGGGNVDRMADFSHGVDTIALDDAVFTTLPIGALNANAFVTGTAAGDADDRIIYDSTTGNIYYDADGNGAGAAVLFATVSAGTTITNTDFIVF